MMTPWERVRPGVSERGARRSQAPGSRSLVAVCVVGLLLSTAQAHGHELDTQRKLVLQVAVEETLLLVLYELPRGRSSDLARALYDTNRDGTLAGTEEKSLAAGLATDALRGIGLARDGVELASHGVDWRVELGTSNESPIMLALLVRFSGGAGRYEVRLDPAAGATATTSLEVEAGVGLIVARAVSAPEPDQIGVAPLLLGAGDTLWYELAPAQPAAAAPP